MFRRVYKLSADLMGSSGFNSSRFHTQPTTTKWEGRNMKTGKAKNGKGRNI